MLSCLAPHRQSSTLIRPRIQPALHRLTDRDILILDALAHLNTGAARLLTHHIRKVKIEDHFSLVHTARHDEIRIHHAVIPVDHEVGINPVVQRSLTFPDRTRLLLRALANDWAPLQTIVLTVFDHVFAVIKHTVEALVQIRHVITSIEIVIDKHFPVAVEVVMAPLKPMQVAQLQTTRLRDQIFTEKILDRDCETLDQFHKNPILPLRNLQRHETITRTIETAHT